ncbi:MAG: hypothetical protein WD668_07105, partial [Saccharospirillum sp.]
SVSGGQLLIRCREKNSQLIIEIENPLVRAAPEPAREPRVERRQAPRGNQVALQNIRHRLATLYGDTAKLFAAADDQTYRVRLTLPAQLLTRGTERSEL